MIYLFKDMQMKKYKAGQLITINHDVFRIVISHKCPLIGSKYDHGTIIPDLCLFCLTHLTGSQHLKLIKND